VRGAREQPRSGRRAFTPRSGSTGRGSCQQPAGEEDQQRAKSGAGTQAAARSRCGRPEAPRRPRRRWRRREDRPEREETRPGRARCTPERRSDAPRPSAPSPVEASARAPRSSTLWRRSPAARRAPGARRARRVRAGCGEPFPGLEESGPDAVAQRSRMGRYHLERTPVQCGAMRIPRLPGALLLVAATSRLRAENSG